MRLSTCLLPIYSGAQTLQGWARAEELGFHAGYTYDHLNWREPFRAGPWGDAFLTLTAAAGVTSRLRLGTLVTTPNFRHPLPLAKAAVTLADLSAGRFTLGLGAGTDGYDAVILGQAPLSPRERQDRLEEFAGLLQRLLTEDSVTHSGRWYSAIEAWVRPQPGPAELPLAVAGTGPRGQRLAARLADAWITTGDQAIPTGGDREESRAAVRRQVERLETSCREIGRDPGSIERILLTGFTPDDVTSSPEAFLQSARAYARAGITEIVVHAPIPGTQFAMPAGVYEQIAALGPELAGLAHH